jgi:hypothetical protein
MIAVIRCLCDQQTIGICTPTDTPKCPVCGRVWTLAVTGKVSPSFPSPAFAIKSAGTTLLKWFGVIRE